MSASTIQQIIDQFGTEKVIRVWLPFLIFVSSVSSPAFFISESKAQTEIQGLEMEENETQEVRNLQSGSEDSDSSLDAGSDHISIPIEALIAFYSVSPDKWPDAETTDGVAPVELAPLAPAPLQPPDAVALGSDLFKDTLLSRDHTVSCASCHESRLSFTDARRMAVGIDGREGSRNTQAIFAVDQWESFFWDGRASSAEDQVQFPIVNPLEMDNTMEEVLVRLNSHTDYPGIFRQVYPEAFSEAGNSITADMLAAAIVAFEKTLEPPTGPYKQFIELAWEDPAEAVEMLTESELRGLHLYRTKAKCMTCHEGPLLSDNEFHGTGLHYYGRRYHDLGRYEITGVVTDAGLFRTPSLLGLNETGPWMHNGLFGSMRGIINLYDAGGARPKPRPEFVDDPLFPVTSELLPPLDLTSDEKTDLEAFLKLF